MFYTNLLNIFILNIELFFELKIIWQKNEYKVSLFILYNSSHLHNTNVCICGRLVMRFCGGPLDSGGPCLPSTVRLLVARRLLLVVTCPFFVLVARHNVGFVLAALTLTLQIMIKYTKSSVSFMGGTSFLGNKFEDASTEKKFLDIN